ncbi:ribonuclease R [Chitinivorax sp. B]|uniref:ribonuclease R n=1 Tax=Chitinivorax sp. B TaxID=2502235 RepID=UPI00201771B4|nr:ribonuclease R [Chitinivorax sp. B]
MAREKANYPNPLPSREFIIQILTDKGVPVYADSLADWLDIRQEEISLFERRLRAMERDGEIMLNRKGAICIAEKLDLIKGRVQGHKDGYGFLVPDDGGDDLFLGPKEMHKVLHGDRALVKEVGKDFKGRREGRIVEVLERRNAKLVGRLFNQRGVLFVVAEDKRISQDILVAPQDVGDAQSGQVVMVELIAQPDKYAQPQGRVIEILGNYGDSGMEIEIALRKHDLPFEFSAEAEAQAKKTPKKVRKLDWKPDAGLKREDLREMPLVTIDGETARDFDDAVYCEPAGKGWRLVVAIADVSYYVRPDDALDITSRERGNSVYFPRRVIPMLPEQLSNGICSLNPDVERMCMVCDISISARGEIKKYRFFPAVMHSKARLTYNKVWEMLSEPASPLREEYSTVLPHVEHLYKLFQILLAARHRRGAIDFETVETQMIFNDGGKIDRIVPVSRNDAHRLIEECMLAANVCASDFLQQHEHPALYRIHEGPTAEKLDNLRSFLKEFALTLPGGDDPHAKDYAQLLEKVKQKPEAALLQTAMLRSLQQAVYSPDNVGHFGLAYDGYTHFTSPIRRYPDLLVHRAIKAVLREDKYKPGMKWAELGIHCSMTERRADDATRDVENWLKCFYMKDRVGECFTGTVSAATSFGIFVLLDDVYVEGLVHISELGSDYFRFDQALHCLVGERTGQRYRLGDRVRIKVVRVDLETSKIDFVLVEDKPDADADERGPVTPTKSRVRKPKKVV